mgnify:FL=1
MDDENQFLTFFANLEVSVIDSPAMTEVYSIYKLLKIMPCFSLFQLNLVDLHNKVYL